MMRSIRKTAVPRLGIRLSMTSIGTLILRLVIPRPAHAQYMYWMMESEVVQAIFGNGTMSVGLAGTDETSANWAYFAKSEWLDARDSLSPRKPCVLYAYGSPLWPIDLFISPDSVAGGDTANGVVYMTGPAPPGGVVITLGSSDPNVASVPATVTIPEGQWMANFTITTVAPEFDEDVTISATYGSMTKTAVLTVTVP